MFGLINISTQELYLGWQPKHCYSSWVETLRTEWDLCLAKPKHGQLVIIHHPKSPLNDTNPSWPRIKPFQNKQKISNMISFGHGSYSWFSRQDYPAWKKKKILRRSQRQICARVCMCGCGGWWTLVYSLWLPGTFSDLFHPVRWSRCKAGSCTSHCFAQLVCPLVGPCICSEGILSLHGRTIAICETPYAVEGGIRTRSTIYQLGKSGKVLSTLDICIQWDFSFVTLYPLPV